MTDQQNCTPDEPHFRDYYVGGRAEYDPDDPGDGAAREDWDAWLARVRRDAAYVAWHEGQASGWRAAQEECEMNGMVGDLYHPHTETEPCPYAHEETP